MPTGACSRKQGPLSKRRRGHVHLGSESEPNVRTGSCVVADAGLSQGHGTACPAAGSGPLYIPISMDRVQQWRIRGNLDRVAEALEASVRSNQRVRRIRWNFPGENLIANTAWSLLYWPQKITIKVEKRSTSYWDVAVCSEMLSLMDGGRNKQNLDQLRQAMVAAGFAVEGGPVRTSWRRSTRP